MHRLLSFHLVSRERWDQHGYLWGGIIFAMVICSLGAAGNWYRWLHGKTGLHLPILLTCAALVILVAVPRRFELVASSIGYVFILSILATILRRFALVLGLETIGVSGALFLLCTYIERKLYNDLPKPRSARR